MEGNGKDQDKQHVMFETKAKPTNKKKTTIKNKHEDNHNKVLIFVATDVNSDVSAGELRAINVTAPARVYTEYVTETVENSSD